MCLIIYKPENVRLTANLAIASFRSNRDGWGVLYTEAGELKIEKGMTEMSMLETLEKLGDREFALHTRIGTHGSKNMDNCHPFRVTKEIGLMHNGIINIKIKNQMMSDTWHYTQYIKEYMADSRVLEDKSFMKSVEDSIGASNKMLFMRNDGAVYIANENSGVWYGDMWMSHRGIIPYKETPRIYSVPSALDEATKYREKRNARKARFKKDPRFFRLSYENACLLESLFDKGANLSKNEAIDKRVLISLVESNLKVSGMSAQDVADWMSLEEDSTAPVEQKDEVKLIAPPAPKAGRVNGMTIEEFEKMLMEQGVEEEEAMLRVTTEAEMAELANKAALEAVSAPAPTKVLTPFEQENERYDTSHYQHTVWRGHGYVPSRSSGPTAYQIKQAEEELAEAKEMLSHMQHCGLNEDTLLQFEINYWVPLYDKYDKKIKDAEKAAATTQATVQALVN